MYLLHVVVVQGQGAWPTGLTLWVLIAAVGGTFARSLGEWQRPDALLLDLVVASAGGALGNAAAAAVGGDVLALIFGVRTFWAALGAVVALCLAHDAAHVWHEGRRATAEPAGSWQLLNPQTGGFLTAITWLSGWPSEPGLIEAVYDGGRAVKLLPDALYYQVRLGPLIGSRVVPLLPGLRVAIDRTALVLTAEPGSPAAERLPEPARLDGIAPSGHLRELVAAIGERVAGGE